MKRLLVAVAVLVAAAVAYGWWNGDRRQIGKTLDRFEHACEKNGPDSPLALVTRTETILATFAPGLLVTAEPYEGSFTDPRAVAGAIHRYRAMASHVSVTDGSRTLDLTGNGTAEMRTVFHVRGDGAFARGESFRASIFWVKVDGDWKIRELRIVERLERGGILP